MRCPSTSHCIGSCDEAETKESADTVPVFGVVCVFVLCTMVEISFSTKSASKKSFHGTGTLAICYDLLHGRMPEHSSSKLSSAQVAPGKL